VQWYPTEHRQQASQVPPRLSSAPKATLPVAVRPYSFKRGCVPHQYVPCIGWLFTGSFGYLWDHTLALHNQGDNAMMEDVLADFRTWWAVYACGMIITMVLLYALFAGREERDDDE